MRSLLALSVGLNFALGVAAAVVLALARIQPLPAGITRLHLNDCLPPCWIGIVPGATTIADAKAKMLAIYFGKDDLSIRDSGFASGPVDRTAVENTIEGADFYLFIRMGISDLVDGSSETVQSIALFSSEVRGNNTPTVADILGAFGAPQGVVIEESPTPGSEVTLRYAGLDVVFHTRSNRVDFTETPHLYLGRSASNPTGEYRRWKGFGTLILLR